MKTKKQIVACIAGLALITGIESFTNTSGGSPAWAAPANADTIRNPFKANDAAALAAGKKVFTQFCATCHGTSGKGDGIAASSLNPKPANFLAPLIVKESDGAIFWKITNGKAPMPSWEKVLRRDQRWQVVCYIRSIQEKYVPKS